MVRVRAVRAAVQHRTGAAVATIHQLRCSREKAGSPMWYLIEGRDGPDVLLKRQRARAAHLQRLEALRDAGRLLLAGPCPAIDAGDPGPAGFSGSLVVAGFESLELARAWADADPYVAEGVYEQVDVRPFRPVLP